MKKRLIVIIVQNGKILLIHRVKENNEYWIFPGGRIEKDDLNNESALKRKCKEELGVDINFGTKFFLKKLKQNC